MPHAKLEMALESRSKSKDAAAAGEFKKVAADGKYFDQDRARRANVRQLYRKLDKTEEWAENNYYHLLIGAQNAQLITVNAFWRDYAAWGGKTPFFSTNLAEASRSFAEMMLALAVLDLPYEAGKHAPEYKDATLTLKAGSPLVVYHKEIKPAPEAAQKTPILVSQNYFRQSDRYTYVDNEKVDKYVADEFLTAVVYGCQVVVTNPTSSRQKLDVLLQIPRGTIPVLNGQYTRGVHIDLEPYRTQTFEYFFYFPQAGAFPHYPVHVARNEALIAFCPATTLTAVDKPTKIDRTSWDYISQNGTPEEVVRFLNDNNLLRINLERIAWRMRDAAFFNTAIPLLAQRHLYNHVLWSYALQHNAAPALREYLRYSDGFVAQCGAALDSPLLTINPVERKSYQHLEYSPLVNARAHKVGKQRVILNDTLAQQYQRLLRILACHAQLDADDLMAVTYYLLLQDRVEEALAAFQKVDPKKLATALQYDYFQACLDFYGDKHDLAGGIAKKYLAYPVDRWRNLFAAVDAQLAEVESKDAAVIDKENREQQQAKLAATEPGFDFKVEARQITVNYQNLTECRVNYYLMDIELLFSRNPFVQQYTDQFSFIRPNQTDVVKLPAKKTTLTFDLPKQFSSSNVMVEIEAGAVRKSQAYFASQLALQVIENYGQLKVTVEKSGAPLAKAYVKVYARMQGGEVKFYKDGYTDLRGRFDYASLSTDEADRVERFSVLVLSETDGAVVREAAAPKQ